MESGGIRQVPVKDTNPDCFWFVHIRPQGHTRYALRGDIPKDWNDKFTAPSISPWLRVYGFVGEGKRRIGQGRSPLFPIYLNAVKVLGAILLFIYIDLWC